MLPDLYTIIKGNVSHTNWIFWLFQLTIDTPWWCHMSDSWFGTWVRLLVCGVGWGGVGGWGGGGWWGSYLYPIDPYSQIYECSCSIWNIPVPFEMFLFEIQQVFRMEMPDIPSKRYPLMECSQWNVPNGMFQRKCSFRDHWAFPKCQLFPACIPGGNSQFQAFQVKRRSLRLHQYDWSFSWCPLKCSHKHFDFIMDLREEKVPRPKRNKFKASCKSD